MLQETTKNFLKTSKNLLAFSAGGDSTALFYILLENKISFDIAIVDYGLREQSKKEVLYAQDLAQKHALECFVHRAETIEKNFEAKARDIRYTFFEQLIEKYNYTTLLTAHHLGDRLEWFLMQFTKGAGCVELSGMQSIEKREKYTLVRPLLEYSKEDLLAYLEDRNLHFFEDESNKDESYKRNFFRHNFSEPLLKEFSAGIKKSFSYIDRDKELLVREVELKKCNQLAYFEKKDTRSNVVAIDSYLKSLGHMITAKEKERLLAEETLVIGRKYIVAGTQKYLFVAPYIEVAKIEKNLKERMRFLKIPPKLRPYLASDSEALVLVSLLLE